MWKRPYDLLLLFFTNQTDNDNRVESIFVYGFDFVVFGAKSLRNQNFSMLNFGMSPARQFGGFKSC